MKDRFFRIAPGPTWDEMYRVVIFTNKSYLVAMCYMLASSIPGSNIHIASIITLTFYIYFAIHWKIESTLRGLEEKITKLENKLKH